MESVLMLTLVFLILLIGNQQNTAVDSQVIQGNAQGLQNANVGLPAVNGNVPMKVDHDQNIANQGVVAKPRRKKKKKRAKRSEINSVNKPVVDNFNRVDPVGKGHKQLVKTPQPLPLDGVNNLNNIVHNNQQIPPVNSKVKNIQADGKHDESLVNSARNENKRLVQQNGQEGGNALRNVIRNHQDSDGSYAGNVNRHDNQQPNFGAPPGPQSQNVQPPGPGIGQDSNNARKNLQFAQVHDNVANIRGNERKGDSVYVKNSDTGNPSKDKFGEVVTEPSHNQVENHVPLNKDDNSVNRNNNFPNNNFQNFPQNDDRGNNNNDINNNNINNNNNNNNNNDNSNFGGQQWNPVPQQNNPQRKQDSMRIMWDWSDFLINYEQYVMPEQKVRRAPHATTGEPWPLPQYYITSKTKLFRLDKEKFHFRISKETCDIIEKATERYKDTILYDTVQDMYDNLQHAQGTSLEDVYEKYGNEIHSQAQYIEELNIKIRQPCTKFPSEKMDESYDLFVKRTGAFLWANEVWGALRGLETFSQLVFKGTNDELYIRDTVINDYPRFSHRGILLDSSRHYIFKEVIFDVLEGMSQNKMNVLHWHIVDDQSFPYQCKMYPDLSDKGAYHPTFVYTHEDIDEIIEYARLRGIRVMPEFDTPGHTYSWGLSRPDLLTQCYQGSHPVNGYLGPLDPSKNETYRFLRNLFNEVLQVFKDDYIHLGGDEVPMTCWSSNPEVLALLNRLEGKPDQPINLNNVDPYMYSYDIRKVLEFYEKRLTQSLKEIGKRRKNGVRFVMWQEIMNNNIQLPNDTIIQIWQGDMSDVQRAIDMGYQTLYSTCWYLDLIEYGVKWPKYYNCDPADTSMGYQIDEKKVLGGEACLWAEYIDNENLMSTLWPRASATAERLWSSKDVKDVEAAGTRLSEHRCRMLSRGLSVGQISGPDYCLRRGHRRDRENQGNCSSGHCMSQKNMVQIERIDLRVHQRANPLPDCNQIISHGGSAVSVFLVLVVFLAIIISIKVGGTRMVQVRFCKNKNIFIAFVVILLVYFMCSTSLWMQVLEFKGSFEKRIKSSYSDKG